MTEEKKLVTIKKANEKTGLSIPFLKSLVSNGALQGHYIKSALLISIVELEEIAKPKINKKTTAL